MTGPGGPTPPPHGPEHPTGGVDPRQQPAPGSSGASGFTRVLSRQFIVPAAALAVAVIAVVLSFVLPGGIANRASDSEVCSAYFTAERSWDSGSTDATEIEDLGSVARRHSDEDIRSAGERLDSLTGIFSYSRYASIVQPIQRMC